MKSDLWKIWKSVIPLTRLSYDFPMWCSFCDKSLFAERKRALSLHISKLEVICLPKNIKKNILRYSNAKWYICCQVPKTTQFCRYTMHWVFVFFVHPIPLPQIQPRKFTRPWKKQVPWWFKSTPPKAIVRNDKRTSNKALLYGDNFGTVRFGYFWLGGSY